MTHNLYIHSSEKGPLTQTALNDAALGYSTERRRT